MDSYEVHKMTIKEIAEQVSKLLDAVSEEKDERFYIVFEGIEKKVWIHQKWDDTKRVIFSGSFDKGLSQFLPYGEAREKIDISVSIEKSPESMAKSIQSRLLPAYFRMHEICSKRKAEYDKQEEEKQTILKTLSEYFPDPVIRQNELMWYGGRIQGSIQITYHSPDDMTVKLSCGLETIKKILKVLKSNRNEVCK